LNFEANVPVTLEGPLFEGPESGQGSLKDDFDAFLASNAIERKAIKRVTLRKAFVKVFDDRHDLITDVGITFAGSDLDMTQIAVLNPFPANAPEAALSVGTEAKLAPFFKADDFIVLLDLGIAVDYDEDIRASARMEFDITVKK
jgi:hypothetical protein